MLAIDTNRRVCVLTNENFGVRHCLVAGLGRHAVVMFGQPLFGTRPFFSKPRMMTTINLDQINYAHAFIYR